MKPEDCIRFDGCSAPLCPLDSDIDKRIWFAGEEEICMAQAHNKHRWIRKQRSIVKRGTKTWFGHAVTQKELFDASRPREMSEEQRKEASDRLRKYRKIKSKTISCAAVKK